MQGDTSNQPEPATPWQFKPGETITPGQASEPTASVPPQPEQPAPEAAPQAPSPAPEAPTTPQPRMQANGDSIRWTASEFIAHNKSLGWYLLLAVVALAVSAGIFLLTKDKISSGVILVAAIALGAYGARQPRQMEYELGPQGLRIGGRYHPYEEFRSFAIIPEGAFSSVVFTPLKRFMPFTTIYYDPADEERIVTLLADRLPIEDRSHDMVDRFMHRIRY